MGFNSHQSTRGLARVTGAFGLALAAFGLGVVSEGCLLINQEHCALNEGSCPEGLLCDECASGNNGCVAEPAAGCAYVASGTDSATTSGSETSNETTIGTTTSTPETTEPLPTDPTTDTSSGTTDETTTTTGTPSCDPQSPNVGCDDPDAPYCVGEDVCGTCDALADCVAVDPMTPACDAASGYCVECTATQSGACTNPNESICNPYTQQCDACFEHSQCASMACNIETGICFPASNVIWVKARQNCAGEDGSEENPYCSLAYAIEQHAEVNTPITFKLLHEDDAHRQTDSIIIDGDFRIAIVNGEEGGSPMPIISTLVTEDSALVVGTDAYVFIDGVRFHENPQEIAQPMIVLEGNSRLYIDRSQMTDNNSLAWAKQGELHIRRTTIAGNAEGVLVTGGTVDVENSFFSGNGNANNNVDQPPGTNKYAPLRVNGGGKVVVTHTTFVDNSSLFASVLDCIGASNLDNSRIRNSTLIGKIPLENNGNNMGCGSVIDAETNYMVAFPKVLTDIGLDDVFDGPAVGGVYRALARGELAGVATHKSEDPYMDFDGQGRPLNLDASDYAGADIP
ncbi:MAG: hypothetical protein H6713_33185 [Myxococcales bacterium]|nr:hypothetical protein [Myxococcales bacterium]MCB9754816.1 hypothetical protein [Myxococcales bacterium]